MMIGPRDYPAPENDNGEQEYDNAQTVAEEGIGRTASSEGLSDTEKACTVGENDDEEGLLGPDG